MRPKTPKKQHVTYTLLQDQEQNLVIHYHNDYGGQELRAQNKLGQVVTKVLDDEGIPEQFTKAFPLPLHNLEKAIQSILPPRADPNNVKLIAEESQPPHFIIKTTLQ